MELSIDIVPDTGKADFIGFSLKLVTMLKLVWNFYKDTPMEKSDLQTRLEEARARRKAQIAQYTKKEAEKSCRLERQNSFC